MSTSDGNQSNSGTGPPDEQTLFDQVFGSDAGDEQNDRWPSQERFPLNEEGREVGEAVAKSYEASSSFLIVTAYTSLEHLLSFFGRQSVGDREIDVVLGSEPSMGPEGLYEGTRPVAKQARDYWLERGVSVLTGGGALRLIRAIEEGNVHFYAAENLHAKIYVGDDSAMVGSSNFSRQGFRQQREANARFEKENRRYEELKAIGQEYRNEAEECTDQIRKLLEDLLRPVEWEEALARAAAEVLEGDWVDRYPEAFRLLQEEDLWPHQEQAIAQGLWILDTRGSVLVADATGSGKTRIGTHLLYGLLNRLWAQGQVHRTDATVVCPPQVTDEWQKEIRRSKANKVSAISHGRLSMASDAETVREEVRKTNVLFLDEAHNYLSRSSKRSKAITSSAADYSALLTATPINRGTSDLLRMIELLGLDNLSDRDFRTYRDLRKKSNLTGEDEKQLRRIVRQCTIRRTKQDLNEVVKRRPEGYTDQDGTTHRFPEHNCRTYRTGETEDDKRLARKIGKLAEELKGLLWLRSFKAPIWVIGDTEREEAYLERKVKGADGLSTHMVRRALQSSKAALLEVVYGTEAAAEQVGLQKGLKNTSGDYLSAAGELLQDPPEENSNLKEAQLPEWLTTGLEETVEEERATIRKIGQLAKKLSTARTEARARKIRKIAAEEPVLLAFGAKPLTLHALRDHLQNGSHIGGDRVGGGQAGGGPGPEVVVADGSLSARRKRAVKKKLGLGGGTQTTIGPDGEGKEGLIALCSDAMSEGLNLQRASSVVLLDTPSVIRIAEQRVGRIDRMDSPHDAIDVWWPEDSRPFQSARRDLLIERYNLNERLMGNNIDLPDSLVGKKQLFSEEARQRASTNLLIDQYKTHQKEGPERRLDDAFRPARELVGLASPGEREREPLVSEEVYEKIAGADATVWSRVSLMESEDRWGFFCLRGREGRAPRWILLEEGGSPAAEEQKGRVEGQQAIGFDEGGWDDVTRLGPIARRLRKLLPRADRAERRGDPALWREVEPQLDEMIGAIRENERDLLSNKAQHALGLLQTLASEYKARAPVGSERAEVCQFLSRALSQKKDPPVDLHSLADRWLGIVQPRYVEWKRARRNGRAVRIKDMDDHLIHEPIDTEALRRLAKNVKRQKPVERRLATAIIALPF